MQTDSSPFVLPFQDCFSYSSSLFSIFILESARIYLQNFGRDSYRNGIKSVLSFGENWYHFTMLNSLIHEHDISVHYIDLWFLLSEFYSFSIKKVLKCFARLIPICLFVYCRDCIVFFILVSICWLIAYKNKTEFCEFILYCTALPNSLIF